MELIIQTTEKQIKYCTPDYKANSERAGSETNDCVVRAIASGFDIDYDVAHNYCRKELRRYDKKGVRTLTIKRAFEVDSLFGCRATELKNQNKFVLNFTYSKYSKGRYVDKVYTVGRFIEDHSQGTYFVLVKNHAFIIINGVVFGNWGDAQMLKRTIYNVWKIEKLNEDLTEVVEEVAEFVKVPKEVLAVGTKQCLDCGEIKPRSEFKQTKSKDGHQKRCKCCRAKMKQK